MSIQISYFIHSLKEAGTTVQAINYCNAAVQKGQNVTLVTAFDGGAFKLSVALGGQHVCLGGTRKFESVAGVYRFIKYIRRHRPDVIISGAKRVNLWAILAKVISRGKTQLIVTLTNDLEQKTKRKPKGRFIEAAILRKIYQIADMTLVLTPEMKIDLMSKGFPERKLSYAPPPIDLSIVRQKSAEPIDHLWLNEPKHSRKTPVIVAAGRLSTQKNYPLLLRAFARANTVTALRLIIIGTGNDAQTQITKDMAQSLEVESQIDFIGFKPNPYPYFAQANIFALSSSWEGFGIVLLEALSCETTIVSTNCPTGPAHILDGGTYGYLTPCEDETAFSEALLHAAAHPIDMDILKIRTEAFSIDASMALYAKAIAALPRNA